MIDFIYLCYCTVSTTTGSKCGCLLLAMHSSAIQFIYDPTFSLHLMCGHRSQYALQNAKCLIDVEPLVILTPVQSVSESIGQQEQTNEITVSCLVNSQQQLIRPLSQKNAGIFLNKL